MQTIQPIFAIPAMLLPFYTAFTGVDLAWGWEGQPKAKAIGFIFSHSFHVISIKFDVMKQFNLNIPVRFSKICGTKEITAVLQTVSKL